MPASSPADANAAQILLLSSLKEENERLVEEKQILREVMVQLTQQNATLREDNRDLSTQNAAYLQQISHLQSSRKNNNAGPTTQRTHDDAIKHDTQPIIPEDEKTITSTSNEDVSNKNEEDDSSNDPAPQTIKQLQVTVEELQQRIMILLQEKLSMHDLIEDLEHQLVASSNDAVPTKLQTNVDETPVVLVPSETSWARKKKEKAEEKERARIQKLERLLGDDKPVAASPKGSRLVTSMGSIFSNRSRTSSRDEHHDGDLVPQQAPENFDIQWELEQQMDKRVAPVHPNTERMLLRDSSSRQPVEPTKNDDRASWDRMKNDQDLSGMFSMTGAGGEGEGVSQSQFLQNAIEQKQRQAQEKRRSSSWVGRFGILPSSASSTKAESFLPRSTNVDDKRAMWLPGDRQKISSAVTIIMDDDDDDLLEQHFQSRRESSEEGHFGTEKTTSRVNHNAFTATTNSANKGKKKTTQREGKKNDDYLLAATIDLVI